MTDQPPPTFPESLNRLVASRVGDAVFGLNVLDQLVLELENAASQRRTERAWGPAVLGCAMWMDDPELLTVLHKMANVCVVVTKQTRRKYERPETRALRELASVSGLAQDAYPELSELAAPQDGMPVVVGPEGRETEDSEIQAVREVGFRRVGDRLVPIMHAKILLLGQMFWSDEHPAGHTADIIGFRPKRLWIGSANFTKSSRSSLEMGLWTSDPELLAAGREWLLSLIAISEPLGTGADYLDPELLQVEYDDAAMIEHVREAQIWSDVDDDF